jgi:hypothetical protein
MNITYLIYEAERPRSMAEQREADAQAGEIAAAVVRLGHSLRHPVTLKRTGRRDGWRPATTSVARAVPRPRQPADR